MRKELRCSGPYLHSKCGIKKYIENRIMSAERKKIAIVENHELGIYSIRHDLVKAISEIYDVTVLTEVDDSFKNGDLEKAVRFVDVGKAVLNPVTAARYYSRLKKALKELNPDVC